MTDDQDQHSPDTPQKPQRKQPAQDILAGEAPRATRFRKPVVWGAAGTVLLLSVGLLAYGLGNSNHPKKPVASSGASSGQRATANLGPTATYATVHPPAAKSEGSHSNAAHPSGSKHHGRPLKPVHHNTKTAAETKAAAKRRQKALSSPIFFASNHAPGTPGLGASHSSSKTKLASAAPASSSDRHTDAGRYRSGSAHTHSSGSDESLQGEKRSFIKQSSSNKNDYVSSPEQKPISKYEVQAGTVIPAALITGINSNLPGQVIAQVTQNVYDTVTGHYLLIPQGSRLIGKYDSRIGFAQNRALVVWNRLILPNGNSINLGGMIGADQSGASGLHDRVNAHNLALFAALGSATLLSIGPQLALSIPKNGNGNTNIFTNPAQRLGQEASNLGQELVNKQLNRPNTVTIRPGWPLRVLVNKDMVLKPYDSR